jgi:arabinose-5-phosphate isomerase
MNNKSEPADSYGFGKQVIEAEIRALQGLVQHLDQASFCAAIDLILNCRGRIIVTGIGKAGIIGEKISATLSSTGTPSHSVHPIEAIHGDLGRILRDDVVLALSNSGETEIVTLLPHVQQIGAKIIGITANKKSTLAKFSDIVIEIGEIAEACPLGLAPSASTTAMLAVGDALALAVARRRNFDREDYALFHPGGELGRKLIRVEQLMRVGEKCCSVHLKDSVQEAIGAVNRAGAGAVNVVDDEGRLVGIFTDGDLRRHLQQDRKFLDAAIERVMTKNPKRATVGSLAAEAGRIMRQYKIDELPVVDAEGKLRGILDVQDLLEAHLIKPTD